MTENEESLDKQNDAELFEHMQMMQELSQRDDIPKILGRLATTLLRLTHAQEKLVALAQIDLEQQIEAEIQSRAETMAEEIVEDKTKRGFIGKRKI